MEIDEKVFNLMSGYWKSYGLKPNSVYLGVKQMKEAKDSAEQYLFCNEDDFKSYFGMRFHCVDEYDHLSVGLTNIE